MTSSDAMENPQELENSFEDVDVNVDVDDHKSIFVLYAKIFRLLLAAQISDLSVLSDKLCDSELENLTLPSNEEWRHRVYDWLVELQREKDTETESERMDSVRHASHKDSHDWGCCPGRRTDLPQGRKQTESQDYITVSLKAVSGTGGSMTEARVEPGWRIDDILLAARVLQNARPSPTYANEAEMRRVFGLVYDVLRSDKNILNRALEDGGFWYRNRHLKQRERVVWLLLYDMQGRKFVHRRDGSSKIREKIFKTIGLKDIEDALLNAKTHLAASISRLRIGGSALNLDELLPVHLRIAEGISWADEGAIASGWINTIKVASKTEFVKNMSKLKFKHRDDIKELDENDYVFDPICPKLINLHDRAREKLAISDLVCDHRFVFLERSLCLGAATLAQAIRTARLCGPVILTHPIAPRHTGYLTELLTDIEDAGRLLAFGAGDRRCEYEAYLETLGITLQQCQVFSEKYESPPPSVELERATIVLATPPCSYTGVRDIVDLAVARGGDFNLLESLTSNVAGEMKQPRALLAEQFSTLKYALTRPNIQFLIYEVHTILPSETTEMVRQVVDYANQIAREKYIREHPVKKTLAKDNSGKIAKMTKIKALKQEQLKEQQEDQSQQDQIILNKQEEQIDETSIVTSDIVIPDSDLFEIGSIDEIYGEDNKRMLDPGCFIAIIKRKEMMQFDSVFMIKVAESKGLFGDPDKERPVPKQKDEVQPAMQTARISRKNVKRVKIEIDRVAAPTHSSISRTRRELCPRHSRYIVRDEKLLSTQVRETRKQDARRWWRDAIAFFVHSSEGPNSIAREFRATRSDPLTQKPLFPFHVKKIALSKRCPRQDNSSDDEFVQNSI